ncbi:hypothetical protein B0T25DRAFT_561624 [Lasiosphaeria hispida]|uniref:Uncharacterized protein n=1 Tax=Lasiosphaeria hispida TaxID=260671 RepID=A0AAJ0HTZ3_9PEZI|nr:hypothetical protein B0T25DRAFT_561624 [Lasiosphaeria hispida]
MPLTPPPQARATSAVKNIANARPTVVIASDTLPSIALGYLNSEASTTETFIYDYDGHWPRTGDEVLVTSPPAGNEHPVIVDRIKELIKVKGRQVAPTELERHILT